MPPGDSNVLFYIVFLELENVPQAENTTEWAPKASVLILPSSTIQQFRIIFKNIAQRVPMCNLFSPMAFT